MFQRIAFRTAYWIGFWLPEIAAAMSLAAIWGMLAIWLLIGSGRL